MILAGLILAVLSLAILITAFVVWPLSLQELQEAEDF
jgi:hypothetical protein